MGLGSSLQVAFHVRGMHTHARSFRGPQASGFVHECVCACMYVYIHLQVHVCTQVHGVCMNYVCVLVRGRTGL